LDCFHKIEKDEPIAQEYIGTAHYFGQGVKQSYTSAKFWFQKSADQGSERSQEFLGLMHFHGRGTEVDYIQARLLFEQAALADLDIPNYYLGKIFAFGLGVEQNRETALEYLRASANHGNKSAKWKIVTLLFFGNDSEKAEAIALLEVLANQNYAKAQLFLATILSDGDGVPKNIPAAIHWFERAQKNGKSFKAELQKLKVQTTRDRIPGKYSSLSFNSDAIPIKAVEGTKVVGSVSKYSPGEKQLIKEDLSLLQYYNLLQRLFLDYFLKCKTLLGKLKAGSESAKEMLLDPTNTKDPIYSKLLKLIDSASEDSKDIEKVMLMLSRVAQLVNDTTTIEALSENFAMKATLFQIDEIRKIQLDPKDRFLGNRLQNLEKFGETPLLSHLSLNINSPLKALAEEQLEEILIVIMRNEISFSSP
jgi:TPR repeat protein